MAPEVDFTVGEIITEVQPGLSLPCPLVSARVTTHNEKVPTGLEGM